MKKILYVGIAALSLISLASCNKEDDNFFTETYSIPSYNLITSEGGSESAVVSLSNYLYTMKYPDNSISMKVTDLLLGATKGEFVTPEVPMAVKGIKMTDEWVAEQISFSTKDVPENPVVTDLKCMLTQAAYSPEEMQIPMDAPSGNEGETTNNTRYYERLVPGTSMHYTVMSFNYGDKKVRTFWPDMTFCGSTSSTFPGMSEAFTNTKMSYRVYMHRKQDNSLTGKADLIIYSASFAQGMPDITIVVKDLDVAFGVDGYEISGHNMVPYMVEAGMLQEAPRFIFNELKIEVTGDLTDMHAAMTVAGSMKANFIGKSVKE